MSYARQEDFGGVGSGVSRRFANRWWVVAAAVLGVIVAQGPIAVFTFGVLMPPVTAELGIGRSAFSSALLVLTATAALTTPLFGQLIDRYGIRPVLLPTCALFGLATAALALMPPSLPVIFALFALQGAFSVSQTPTAYVKAISQRFDRRRGLAIGLAMAGAGLGVALVPQYASLIVASHGWRVAYVGLGALILVLGLVPAALFLTESATGGRRRQGSAESPGLSLRQVLTGGRQFWLLAFAFFLAVVSINGTIAQLPVVLAERGFSATAAATAMSVTGLSMILGRILVGYCLDRFFGPHVAIVFLTFPIIGIGLLLTGAGGLSPYASAVLCGLGIGAELDLMGFLVGRYFGLRAMGTTYGILFAGFTFGSGLGPHLMNLSFDATRSFAPAQTAFVLALVCAVAAMGFIGPYRYPVKAERSGAPEEG